MERVVKKTRVVENYFTKNLFSTRIKDKTSPTIPTLMPIIRRRNTTLQLSNMGGVTRVGRGAILQILLWGGEGEFRVVFFQPIYKLYNLYVILNKSSIICHDVALQKSSFDCSFFVWWRHSVSRWRFGRLICVWLLFAVANLCACKTIVSENVFSPHYFPIPTIFDCNTLTSVTSQLQRPFESGVEALRRQKIGRRTGKSKKELPTSRSINLNWEIGKLLFVTLAQNPNQSHRDKKNEVFGGSSTHERAPPAVLVAVCYNLPISSTNLKLLT